MRALGARRASGQRPTRSRCGGRAAGEAEEAEAEEAEAEEEEEEEEMWDVPSYEGKMSNLTMAQEWAACALFSQACMQGGGHT